MHAVNANSCACRWWSYTSTGKFFTPFMLVIHHFHIIVCAIRFWLVSFDRYAAKHFQSLPNKSTGQVEYFCEKCGQIVADIETLLSHTDIVHGGKRNKSTIEANASVRPYLCEVCGKGYTQSSHLYQHLRFHKGMLHPHIHMMAVVQLPIIDWPSDWWITLLFVVLRVCFFLFCVCLLDDPSFGIRYQAIRVHHWELHTPLHHSARFKRSHSKVSHRRTAIQMLRLQ